MWVIVLCADFSTNRLLSFTLFYMVPIGLAAWYMGWRVGVGMALFGSAAWFVGDVMNPADNITGAIRFWNLTMRLGIFVLTAYVLSLVRHLLDHERELARTDSLTGVPNWRYFCEIAARELSRARRYNKSITLAYVDVDNFKEVNDTLGHDAGNELLQEIASTMQHALRLTDIVARVGGDEFVMLLPDQVQGGAQIAVAKVMRELAMVRERSHTNIGFSIGVITALHAPDDIETLVQAADALMYGAKEGGKGTCMFATIGEVPPNEILSPAPSGTA